jgi:glycosyltransferase involved in cell wall biosynthesis
MANGVPVVEPRHGAFPEIVSRTGGGVLVEPNDADALADGLFSLVTDRDLAARLGSAGPRACGGITAPKRWPREQKAVYRDLVVSC